MQTECDFWILLVNISAQLGKDSREQVLAQLGNMSPPTQAIMLRRLRHVLRELAAIDDGVAESGGE